MKFHFTFLILATALAFSAVSAQAQTKPGKNQKPRVVFQLSSGDSLVYKSLVKQLTNLLNAEATASIEIVAHGPGIALLLQNSPVKNSLEKLSERGVIFLACRNTINEKKIDPKMLLPFTGVVPSGLAHVIMRQSEGWSYIKAGF